MNIDITSYRRSHFICHIPCFRITNPTMHSSSTREHPQTICKIKIFLENLMNYLSCDTRKSPTFLTNFCSRTALSNVIIWIHINIKHHLFFHWNEWFFLSLKMSWRCHIENCTYIYFVRHSLYKSLFEIICIFKTEVSAIDIIR